MLYIILMLNEHRIVVAFVIAIAVWITAYGLYFHRMIFDYFRRGRAHNWSVDLATKKVVSQGKEEIY